MQRPSHALCRRHGCVLAAGAGLRVGSGMGEAPLYPTLAPSGSSVWVQIIVSLTHMGTGTLCRGGETPHGPALPALGWTQSSAAGSPLCGGQQGGTTLPTSTPPPKPKKVFWCLPGQQSFGLDGGTGSSRLARPQPCCPLTSSKLPGVTLPSCSLCSDFLAPSARETTPLPGLAEL